MQWQREFWVGAWSAALASSLVYAVTAIQGLFGEPAPLGATIARCAPLGFLLGATGAQIQAIGWRRWASQYFGIDLRSLAVLRIGLALAVLVDLAMRARDLKAHYSNDGILPLDVKFFTPSDLSLHMLSGQAWVQGLLFALAAVCAALMLVGWRTRLMTAVSWFLLISLHTRNPQVLTGGDTLLRMLLFWGIFLPLGARYAIDSALNVSGSIRRRRIADLATLALLVQLACVYGFAGLLKTAAHWRVDGSAAYYALNIGMLTTPFGEWLLNFPRLLRASTFGVLYLELLAPLLIFIPWRTPLFRTVLFLLLLSMHLAFQLAMYLGVFPFAGMVAVFVLVPTAVWDRVARWVRGDRAARPTIDYDDSCRFCQKMALLWRTLLIVPDVRIRRASADPLIGQRVQAENSWVVVAADGQQWLRFEGLLQLMSHNRLWRPLVYWLASRPLTAAGNWLYRTVAARRRGLGRLTSCLRIQRRRVGPVWVAQPLLLIAIFYVVSYNFISLPGWNMTWFTAGTRLPAFGQPRFLDTKLLYQAGRQLRLDQNWRLFAPYPLLDDGWFVMRGHLGNGRQIDLRTGQAPTFAAPPRIANTYPNMRWRKYMEKLRTPGRHTSDIRRFCQYVCRDWNQRHGPDQRLVRLELYFVKERTRPPHVEQKQVPQRVSDHACAPLAGRRACRGGADRG